MSLDNLGSIVSAADTFNISNCRGGFSGDKDKLNFGSPLSPNEASGIPANGEAVTLFGNQGSLKRRRTEEDEETGMYTSTKLGNIIYPESRGYPPECFVVGGLKLFSNTTNMKNAEICVLKKKTLGRKIARTFLSVRHNPYVYHTEDWKPRGCTMYLPLTEDIMINTRNIEQISFENDQFFLADEKGNYVGAKPGNAIHLWRFDSNTRKLYISRSVLFLKDQDYREVQLQLESL